MAKETRHFRMVYPSFTEDELNSAIRGDLKAYYHDELFPLKLSDKDLLVFEQAKKDGFIKQKKTDKQGTWKRATKVYSFWCEIHERIFIAIMERSKFSDIRIDVHTGTNYGEKKIPSKVFDEIANISIKYAKPWTTDTIRRVPNSELPLIISELLSITDINKTSKKKILDEEIQELSLEAIKKRALSANPVSKKQKTETTTYSRDPFVSAYAKKRANGICQLCNLPAPFKDLNGEPYLESHHIVWLSKGGKDTIENTVALCPNCHRKMHVLDLLDDRRTLEQKV